MKVTFLLKRKAFVPFVVLSNVMLILSICSLNASAQADSSFTRHGQPFILIFSDMNYSFNEQGNSKAIELTRAFLGYEYFFSKKISTKINIDLADPGVGELKMTAVIRNAFVQYKNSKFSARFGMIDVDQFIVQQAQWGYRYIYKSFQDAYKFGPPSDLGVAFEYTPVKAISLDMSVLNGEGYKKVQMDSIFKTTFGITLKPINGFVLRGYSDLMKKDYTQTSLAFMAGYNIKNFKAGLEYNKQKNKDMIEGNELSGISVYASFGLSEKFSIFSRYDNLKTTLPDDAMETGDIIKKDGQLIIAGFDYTPLKGLKIAPSYFGYAPKDKSQSFTSKFGLYFEIRF
jgi:hypothetical protein